MPGLLLGPFFLPKPTTAHKINTKITSGTQHHAGKHHCVQQSPLKQHLHLYINAGDACILVVL